MSKILFALVLLILCPKILEVCPNPSDPNAEYVKVFANNTTLSDGEGSVFLKGSGVFYIAKNSTAFFRTFGFYPDYVFGRGMALSNEGEEIFLIENGRVVDSFSWRNAKRGEIYFRTSDGWDYRFQGWTNYSPVSDYVSGRVIVTPANFKLKEKAIVVSYTINDPDTVDANSTFYLDANPVGGVPDVEMLLPDAHFLKADCYGHFHWKFAVAGDKVVITTENWGWNKRGYIVVFKSRKISSFLRRVVEHDSVYEVKPKRIRRSGYHRSYGCGMEKDFRGRVEVFVLPDRDPIPRSVKSAKRRLLIEAPYIEYGPLLDAIAKVSKGVKVKVLVSDEKSEKLLETFARIRGLNLSVRRMKNLHGKMIVVDDVAIVTSANMNSYGLKRNREIGVIIYDEKVAEFLAGVFEKDFGGKKDTEYLIPAILATIIALVLAHRWFK